MHIPDNFILIDVQFFLKQNRSRSWREQILTMLSTLCRFLQENGLVTVHLIDEDQLVSDQLEVRRKDFTDEGFEFYRRAEQKWLGAIDRGTPPTDTRILERELAKLRAEKESAKD
jgi:hypothetical protein